MLHDLSAPVPRALPALLQRQAAVQKTAPALLAPAQSALSYAALQQQVTTISARLQQLGLTGQARIAIVLPNGPALAVAWLAASCTAISAPLNPAYTAAEFDFYLTDLGASALLTADLASPVCAVAQARGIPVVEITPTQEVAGGFTITSRPVALANPPAHRRAVQPDDVALILYTSGTTARPKQVPLTHANLCAAAHNIARTLQLTPQDRTLNIMPLFHIHGLVAALLASLAAGGSVVLTPGFEASQFFPWLQNDQPTWYTAVPTMHQAIVTQAAQGQTPLPPTKLRFVRSSSASLPPTVLAALEEIFSAPVIEAYGMTEAAHQMTSNPLPPLVRKLSSVGMAAGPTVAIMAEADNTLLPIGTIGEVVIRGQTVTQGYLNNAEANANAFTNGWFRTGDQGHLDADGYLFLTGRLKELINRGGEKVAPREIEEVLLTHPAVAQAAAFAIPHPTLGEDVAAAVVLTAPQAATAQELRHFLFGQLADHKIPSQLLIVAKIPQGQSGKIQRLGLAQQLAEQLDTPFVAPTGPLETTLVTIWAEVLKQTNIGITHNFFAAGGDSLLAMQVTARIYQHLGLEIQPTLLFAAPTIAELAVAMLLAEIEPLNR